ncbi:MAG: MMPL family transporter [Crocinitomicaceae bacterium]
MFRNVGENQFKRIAFFGIAVIILTTGFMIFGFRKVSLDYDFEKFFPVSDPETNFFMDYRSKFESDNDFLLISLENAPNVFDWTFLEKVKRFQHQLDQVENVKFTKSIVSEKEIYLFPGMQGAVFRPYIDFKEKHLQKDEKDLMENVEMVNTFIAKDKKSICILIRHEDYLSKKKSDNLITDIQKELGKFKFDKVRLAGRTVGQKFYIETMSTEMVLFVGLSYLLVLFFLYVAFRSGWGLLMPQLVLVGTMVWVLGFIGWYGEPVSIVMSILPSIIFVVAMSDVIHLLSRYLDAFRTGIGKFESIKLTLREVGMATFLTSLTTAVGFFSLYFVNVQPIQVFGLIAGFGVLIAFLLTLVLLPILIYFSPDPKYIRSNDQDPFWKKYLAKWFVWVLKRGRKILLFSLLFVAVCGYGTSRMQVNNYLMDEISKDEPIKQDFDYLDEHYGGVRPVELAITLKSKDDSFWNATTLKELDELEKYLESTYGARINVSIVKVLKLVNRSSHAGRLDYYAVPTAKRDVRRFRRAIEKMANGKMYRSLVDSTGKVTRISGVIPDWGNQKVTAKNEALKKYLKQHLSQASFSVHITGTPHLLDKNIGYLSLSLVQGLLVSVGIVALIMGLLYRSLTMVIISMIPNLIPLIFISAVMGYFGINLKTSTAIIFTIAFGIAVDDTIHFLGKFNHELRKGRTILYALKRSYLTTGKAMIITTFILCAGFVLLVFSSFQGTVVMGLLLSLTLFLALIADLTLLPVLLLFFYRKKGLKEN